MTEFVIRIDPARVALVVYESTRNGAVLCWRYVERTWRSWHGLPVVPRFALADRRTHKMLAAIGVALVSAAVIAYAGRSPTSLPPPSKFEARWSSDVRSVELKNEHDNAVRRIDMGKQTTTASMDPRPVRTERIYAPSPPVPEVVPPSPPAPTLQEETPQPYPRPPAVQRKRVVEAPVERNTRRASLDVCARVGWRKEITRGGKSWRCRK